MSIAQTAHRIRERIADFSGILSCGLGKVASRFVGDMMYGLCHRQSVRLTEIGRALEEPIELKKVVERLSRHLMDRDTADKIREGILREGSTRVGEDTLLIVDPSDIVKPYARKMEYLADVRDGSEKKLAKGYWTINVVAADNGGAEIAPLHQSLYSQEADGFVSENHEILTAIDNVAAHTGDKGIWVMDRGGDRESLLIPLLEKNRRFVIRMRGDRHVLYRGRKRSCLDIARGCPTPFAERLVKEDKGEEKAYNIDFGFRRVRLPGRDERLCLIVINGFGREPLMLLTTEEARKSRASLGWFVQAYLTRWRVEETIRFIKQSYDLEDIRVLRYERLRNMMVYVLAAAYFAAVYLGTRAKLAILTRHVLAAAKRLFGIPDFRYYALADGIGNILKRSSKGPMRRREREERNGQLDFLQPGWQP